MAKIIEVAQNLPKSIIVRLLNSPPEDKVSILPPVKPKGGEVYLYQATEETKKGELDLTSTL